MIVGSGGDDDNRLACAGPLATLKRKSDIEAAGARDQSTEFQKSIPLMNIASNFAERIKQLKFSTTVKLVDMINCLDQPRA